MLGTQLGCFHVYDTADGSSVTRPRCHGAPTLHAKLLVLFLQAICLALKIITRKIFSVGLYYIFCRDIWPTPVHALSIGIDLAKFSPTDSSSAARETSKFDCDHIPSSSRSADLRVRAFAKPTSAFRSAALYIGRPDAVLRHSGQDVSRL